MPAKYQQPSLSKVIARLDFNPPYKRFNNEISKELLEIIKRYFPILLPQSNIATEIRFSPADKKFESFNSQRQELQFFSIDRRQRLVINENCLVFDFDKYMGFENFQITFNAIISKVFEIYNDGLNVHRFGLRYINHINPPLNNIAEVFEWADYVDPTLNHLADFIEDKNLLTRSINVSELKYEDSSLKFQYGLFNPDYPANISKRTFLLDFDAYSNWILSKDEIINSLPVFHNRIQELFERSITDTTRELMGRIDE